MDDRMTYTEVGDYDILTAKRGDGNDKNCGL